ncbi:MAG: glycosyltransferase [Coriobacteriia bacterium]|nr:glycosyltransferase [Coriobacteriia bacterium]
MGQNLRNKKVCIVVYGVVDPRAIKTACALAKAGAKVAVLAFTYNYADFTNEPFSVEYHRPAEPKPSTRASRPLRVAENLSVKRLGKCYLESRHGRFGQRLIYEALIGANPDVIHAINADTLMGAAQAAEDIAVPLIYEAYEYWPDHSKDKVVTRTRKQRLFLVDAEANYMDKACAAITVSPYLAREYQREYHLDKQPVVIYNAPTEIEKSTTSAHKPLKVVFAGNLRQGLNLESLLEAARRVPNIQMTFMGTGPLFGVLSAQVISSEHAANVQIVPAVPYGELLTELNSYDLGVIPYDPYDRHLEGALPNKLFEYLSSGLAVLATKTTAFQELSGFQDFGTYFESPSVKSMSNALRTLADSPCRVSEMKQKALQYAGVYCGDVQGRRLRELYESVLKGEAA